MLNMGPSSRGPEVRPKECLQFCVEDFDSDPAMASLGPPIDGFHGGVSETQRSRLENNPFQLGCSFEHVGWHVSMVMTYV